MIRFAGVTSKAGFQTPTEGRAENSSPKQDNLQWERRLLNSYCSVNNHIKVRHAHLAV